MKTQRNARKKRQLILVKIYLKGYSIHNQILYFIKDAMEDNKKIALRKKVGESIKKWRLGENLVLVQVSAKIKVSQGSLSDLENGKCFPSFRTVFMLQKKFPNTDWNAVLFQ